MATFFDSASLVMIPSGYKDDKLYSIKPTDGSGDFTFSRDGAGASPATRVNASGYIEKGRTNIAIYSEDATNAVYAKSNISVTANNATSPIGTATADTITATANGATLQGVGTAVSGRVYTMSVYIKRRTGTGQVGLRGINNLVTNVTITNDWQRYEVFMVSNSTTGRYGVYLATAGDEVDVWGFQLEESLTATEYIATTTAPVSAGLLGDMPRLDYSGGATCPSLLLEPSRTNLISHSEYFGAWSDALGCDIFTNTTTSPEGVDNAATISFGGSADSRAFVTASNSSATYIFSVYAKSSTSKKFRFRISGSGGTLYSNDLTTTSEWQRFDYEYTGDVTAIGITNASTADGGSIDVYGFQQESGSYVSSYIPTYGSASLRGGDSCSNTSASAIIGQTEGTLYTEFVVNGFDDFGTPLCINNGSTSESIWLTTFANGDIRAEVFSGGGVQASFTKSGNVTNQLYKIAIGYEANNFAFYVNGTQVGSTDTSGSVPTGMSRVDFDYTNPTTFVKSALETKQALLFKTRLSNAELAALTTI